MCETYATLSTKDARQATEGDAHYGRLFGRGASDQEPDGNRDTRHKIYIGSDICVERMQHPDKTLVTYV
jgi:hypothetical protein